jgi:hypothetical protein
MDPSSLEAYRDIKIEEEEKKTYSKEISRSNTHVGSTISTPAENIKRF